MLEVTLKKEGSGNKFSKSDFMEIKFCILFQKHFFRALFCSFYEQNKHNLCFNWLIVESEVLP